MRRLIAKFRWVQSCATRRDQAQVILGVIGILLNLLALGIALVSLLLQL